MTGSTRPSPRSRRRLPANLRETAYAIACDLVAADGEATQEELRVLELMRHRLKSTG